MAQAIDDGHEMMGQSDGNLQYCTRCGGYLELVDGTDPDKTDAMGGFRETYECESCGGDGVYRFRDKDARETFTGVCAGQHMWEN